MGRRDDLPITRTLTGGKVVRVQPGVAVLRIDVVWPVRDVASGKGDESAGGGRPKHACWVLRLVPVLGLLITTPKMVSDFRRFRRKLKPWSFSPLFTQSRPTYLLPSRFLPARSTRGRTSYAPSHTKPKPRQSPAQPTLDGPPPTTRPHLRSWPSAYTRR